MQKILLTQELMKMENILAYLYYINDAFSNVPAYIIYIYTYTLVEWNRIEEETEKCKSCAVPLAVTCGSLHGSRLYSETRRLYSETRRLYSETRRLYSETRRLCSETGMVVFGNWDSETARLYSETCIRKLRRLYSETGRVVCGN